MNISLTDLRQAERECLARLAEKENDAELGVYFGGLSINCQIAGTLEWSAGDETLASRLLSSPGHRGTDLLDC